MLADALDEVLRSGVRDGVVPQVAAVAADRDGPVYEGAAGPRVAGWAGPASVDSALRIAGMTETVTAVAAMQQVELGNLELDAPVELYCPEFTRLRVLEGFDGETPKLRPAGLRPTVRQLATHTCGLSYWCLDAELLRWETVTGTPNVLSGSDAALTAPMTADPGSRFGLGTGPDWLGKVVEAVSGHCLDAYLDAYVFGPLGMHRTGFTLDPHRREEAVAVHVHEPRAGWTATGMDWNQSPDWWSGGHGLYSTPRDFLAFQRMLLGGGRLGDALVLEPLSVATMFTDQLGGLSVPATLRSADRAVTADCVPGRDVGWGIGLLLTRRDRPGGRAAGSGGWTGLFNTHFWVDPVAGITAGIHSQSLPYGGPAAGRLLREFERTLYASL